MIGFPAAQCGTVHASAGTPKWNTAIIKDVSTTFPAFPRYEKSKCLLSERSIVAFYFILLFFTAPILTAANVAISR